MARDFKYRNLVHQSEEWLNNMDALSLVKSDCLKPCAQAFAANLARTVTFSLLPSDISFRSRCDTLFYLNAKFRATGKADHTIAEMLKIVGDPALEAEVAAQDKALNALPRSEEESIRWLLGVLFTEAYSQCSVGMQDSLDAMLVSIVLESWLFFEAFASDLWVACVDNGGKSILNRITLYREWEKPDEAVKATDVVLLDSNAKTHPGSFYRETGQASFSKLRSIKKLYGAAFGTEAEKIFDAAADGRINVLSSVRNCIAHSAGKIDKSFKRFLDQAGRFPELQHFKNKEKIALDGEFVQILRSAALDTGLALLRHADGVLQTGG